MNCYLQKAKLPSSPRDLLDPRPVFSSMAKLAVAAGPADCAVLPRSVRRTCLCRIANAQLWLLILPDRAPAASAKFIIQIVLLQLKALHTQGECFALAAGQRSADCVFNAASSMFVLANPRQFLFSMRRIKPTKRLLFFLWADICHAHEVTVLANLRRKFLLLSCTSRWT